MMVSKPLKIPIALDMINMIIILPYVVKQQLFTFLYCSLNPAVSQPQRTQLHMVIQLLFISLCVLSNCADFLL